MIHFHFPARLPQRIVIYTLALSFCSFGHLKGAREGTLLSAALVAIPVIRRSVRPLIDPPCFPEREAGAPG